MIKIGINADAARIDGNLELLRQELAYYRDLGFSHVELAPHGMGVMYNGLLHPARMTELHAVLSDYPFEYVVHGPNPLNLMNLVRRNLERQAFMASIEFTAAVGASVMVYHAGRYVPEEAFQLPGRNCLAPGAKLEMWHDEKRQLKEMGRLAAQCGVIIAVENARPYVDASPYCYGESLFELAQMIREVDHPAVGVALDVGHAYLAAGYHSYDLLNGVEAIAPLVRHIHLHDNFGKSCASYEKKQYELTATGRGDLHLPIGWGSIPAAEIMARLPQYDGVVTLEMRARYRPYFGEALAFARQLLYRQNSLLIS